MALALLPLDQVKLAFDKTVASAPASANVLVRYFANEWMKKKKLALWNVAGMDVRTNNHVEGQ